jgi:hypothetical protein
MRAEFCGQPLLEYDVSWWRTRIYDLEAFPHQDLDALRH